MLAIVHDNQRARYVIVQWEESFIFEYDEGDEFMKEICEDYVKGVVKDYKSRPPKMCCKVRIVYKEKYYNKFY